MRETCPWFLVIHIQQSCCSLQQPLWLSTSCMTSQATGGCVWLYIGANAPSDLPKSSVQKGRRNVTCFCELTLYMYKYMSECNHAHHHSSRIVLQFPRAVPMDRTPAMKSFTPLPLILWTLPVFWMGQNAVMTYASMSYRATVQTAGVSLQCPNSVVKVWLFLWLFLWLPEV